MEGHNFLSYIIYLYSILKERQKKKKPLQDKYFPRIPLSWSIDDDRSKLDIKIPKHLVDMSTNIFTSQMCYGVTRELHNQCGSYSTKGLRKASFILMRNLEHNHLRFIVETFILYEPFYGKVSCEISSVLHLQISMPSCSSNMSCA